MHKEKPTVFYIVIQCHPLLLLLSTNMVQAEQKENFNY